MPHLVVLAALGTLGWLGYKRFVKEAERVSKAVRQAEEETRNAAIGTLIEDPETGEYRLARKD